MKFSWDMLARPFTVLAPMEDVTDSAFRRIVASAARPDVFFTEFTSIDGLFSEGRDEVIRRFSYTEAERPIVAQVWGTDPELFYEAAKLIVDMKFDGMDINMGCPEKNVTKHGAGACLIENHELVKNIIFAAKKGLRNRIPLSLKTRLGYKKIASDWIPFLLEQQLDAITIHGRTAAELSKVSAHWDEIGKYTRRGTVIIGNGDVKNYADAADKSKRYGVDGVMIGRGVFQDLWAFDKRGVSYMDDHEKLMEIMQSHMRLFEKTGKNFAAMKKFFKIYVTGFPGASELRAQLMTANDRKDAERTLGFFARKHVGASMSASGIIAKKVMSLPRWQHAHRVCVYRSLPQEVDTSEFFRDTTKTFVEPAPDARADLFIVPGVAFDKHGNRLGRGRGFYDRLLANKKNTIGIAFEKQMIAEVPHTLYDVPMELVVTEKEIYYGKNAAS